MTKSKVPVLVYLDQFVQFVYLGLFENEKQYIVSCTFRCFTKISITTATWSFGGRTGTGTGFQIGELELTVFSKTEN